MVLRRLSYRRGGALGGEGLNGRTHRLVIPRASQDFKRAFERFELGFADQDAGVVAAIALDFDAAMARRNALVQFLEGLAKLRETQRVKTAARHLD